MTDFTLDQKVDYVRHFISEGISTKITRTAFLEPATEWYKAIKMLGENGDLQYVDPFDTTARQGLLYPFEDAEGKLLLSFCPQVFAAYPKDEDFDLFLEVWLLRLRTYIIGYGLYDHTEERIEYVKGTLRTNGLPDNLINFYEGATQDGAH